MGCNWFTSTYNFYIIYLLLISSYVDNKFDLGSNFYFHLKVLESNMSLILIDL
jgi:hypothetical protein